MHVNGIHSLQLGCATDSSVARVMGTEEGLATESSGRLTLGRDLRLHSRSQLAIQTHCVAGERI